MSSTPVRHALSALVASLLLVCSASAQAPVHVRVALVIGNGAYAAATRLPNPPNDARAMSQTLRSQGFTVIEIVDGTRLQMQGAIRKARDQLKDKHGIGLLYYAGHGLQVSERNYLVPVDARIAKAGDVAPQTVDVQEAITAFKGAGNRMNIIVLDACRNNPFGTASDHQGLAPLDAPAGTFLAYATAPGNVAEDGDENTGNGLYTSFLLQELKRPRARIEDVFKRVRYLVRQKSEGRQIPWESTSLEEDFVFTQGEIVAPDRPAMDAVRPAYEAELDDWKRIGGSRNVADFYAFMQKYPNGSLSFAAQGRIDELNRSALVVQGGAVDGSDAPLAPIRFRPGQNWQMRTITTSSTSPAMETTSSSRVRECNADECIVEQKTRLPNAPETVMGNIFSPAGGHLGVEWYDARTGARTMTSRLDAPQYLVPPGLLQVGQRWTIASVITVSGTVQSTATTAGEARIVAREPVTTEAGTFDTFRIQRTYRLRNAMIVDGKSVESDSAIEETHWVTPAIPYPVKTQIRHRTPALDMLSIATLVRYAEK